MEEKSYSYLFLASIGPVQSFIASARRTRDLWFGSWLLSELARVAALAIAESDGEKSLIFPALSIAELRRSDNPLSVANKIVAVIHGSSHSPQVIGKKVQDAIYLQLDEMRDRAYLNIGDLYPDEKTAYDQIKDLVEYFWVALPYKGGNYADKRDTLEALMAARKNTRNFGPVTWGSSQPKSSIDGQLESVIPERRYPRRGNSVDIKTKATKIKFLYDHYSAGPAERLSAVDILKRRGTSALLAGFPSTSHVAAILFLQVLKSISESQEVRKNWTEYIEEIKKIPGAHIDFVPTKYALGPDFVDEYDGSLFFEERLVDLVDVVATNLNLKPAQEALQKFFQSVDKELGKKARPTPYYAILQADGDRMGEVIDKLAKQEHGEDQHRALSQALTSFAQGVSEIVEKTHQGALVYAGGDDVLAFLPLHTVLQCARDLQIAFRQALSQFKNDEGHSPTLSVGVAVIHHLYHLQDALELARAAEKRAKSVKGVPDKDALAITISKRSGDDYTVTGKWGDIDAHLEELIKLCHDDVIPDGTAYELREMALRLTVPTDDSAFLTLQKAILADAERILRRKLKVPRQKLVQPETEDEEAKRALNLMLARLGIKAEKSDNIETSSVSVEQFINELIVAQTLADAIKLTEPGKELNHDDLAH
jgi:CRISPR-associated protein Cmr2